MSKELIKAKDKITLCKRINTIKNQILTLQGKTSKSSNKSRLDNIAMLIKSFEENALALEVEND